MVLMSSLLYINSNCFSAFYLSPANLSKLSYVSVDGLIDINLIIMLYAYLINELRMVIADMIIVKYIVHPNCPPDFIASEITNSNYKII